MKNNYCIIMAGGIGARFWPMSRTDMPKQFIDILGVGKTLIQQTFDRLTSVCHPENIYIVTNARYKHIVEAQLPLISHEQILCEPARKNTAPCIAYASYKILSKNKNANIIVAPSDHVIMKEDIFTNVLNSALEFSLNNDWLITLGIKPNRPETGYGYIQFVNDESNNVINKVKTFTEKPELDMAKQFIASGDFLWNSGIFIWRLETILQAFKTYLPDIEQLFNSGLTLYGTAQEASFIEKNYANCRSISIDYGIMEKAANVYVIASDFGWSDLGAWGSLYEMRNKDKNNNSIVGNNVMLYDCTNSIVNMPKNKLVVLQGLNDYIVVEDNDILLVCKKEDEQKIRQFVNDVQIEKGDKYI